MTEKKTTILLFRHISNTVKETIGNFDVDALIRNVELDVSTALGQGMDVALKKISGITKRFLTK